MQYNKAPQAKHKELPSAPLPVGDADGGDTWVCAINSGSLSLGFEDRPPVDTKSRLAHLLSELLMNRRANNTYHHRHQHHGIMLTDDHFLH